jgi:hypothetical protein
MGSYMILDTSQEYSKAKAIVIAWFKCTLGPKIW